MGGVPHGVQLGRNEACRRFGQLVKIERSKVFTGAILLGYHQAAKTLVLVEISVVAFVLRKETKRRVERSDTHG